MISGAVYRDGIARTPDGAVYVAGIASGSSVPATAMAFGGMHVSPPAMKISTDGHVYVRFT